MSIEPRTPCAIHRWEVGNREPGTVPTDVCPTCGAVRPVGDLMFVRTQSDGPSPLLSGVPHNRHYGVGCTCPCLGVGTPEHAPGPLCLVWPAADSIDPCAAGCPDPAAHAEGGHDV